MAHTTLRRNLSLEELHAPQWLALALEQSTFVPAEKQKE